MSPVTHALIGWLLGQTTPLSRRERGLVLLAGVAPDLDGLGVVPEALTATWDSPLAWYTDYHRVLAHNGLFCLALAAGAAALARRRAATAGLVLISAHLHLLGDVLGSKGPDGRIWGVPYLQPWSGWELSWSGQWALNAWPNVLITLAALALTFRLAWARGYSPVELLSARADRAFVAALRGRFPRPERP